MARNIEIKARVKDVQAIQKRIERIAGTHHVTLNQEDIFFHVPTGRLKLRIENGQGGQLIHYIREETPGPNKSDYEIVKVPDAEGLKRVLGAALSVTGIVTKTRKLYIIGATRIHLDQVSGLGDYLELEVVLDDDMSEVEGRNMALELMKQLGISEEDLVKGSYLDLIQNGQNA